MLFIVWGALGVLFVWVAFLSFLLLHNLMYVRVHQSGHLVNQEMYQNMYYTLYMCTCVHVHVPGNLGCMYHDNKGTVCVHMYTLIFIFFLLLSFLDGLRICYVHVFFETIAAVCVCMQLCTACTAHTLHILLLSILSL